jgi:glucose/arabinose dehydrogenase
VNELVYVVERAGVVQRVTAEGTVLTPPALDLCDEVRSGGEQGLLGLAFNRAGDRAFVNFTNRDGDTVVAAIGLNGDGTFDTSLWQELLRLEQPYANHNGGEVLMGPDGGLWVPTGDGGSANDPQRVALDPTSRLGKLLRIDPETGEVAIWAAGLRNPWRASFDTVTGDLWIADVGQGAWEEISVALESQQWARGLNFGWSAFEGTHRYHDDQPIKDHVAPVFEYPHGALGCSITGGVRYRGMALGDLRGAYVFSDYCSGRISALPVDDAGTVGQPVVVAQGEQVVAIRADRQGELWVVSLDGDVRPLISAELP